MKSRFGLVPKHADLLLDEALRLRGRSLWQDARARLRAKPAARWSLRFLIAFCVLSFVTPLLPLPSPAVLDLQIEPRPPTFRSPSPRG